MEHKKSITYKDAGVDIDTGNSLVDSIIPLIKKTERPEVMAPLGGFAGLLKINLKKYPNPVLVACTDGVGTKLKIAFEMNQFETIGQDLVAMCVNDMICSGAEPLFFLDYYATGKLNEAQAARVIKGMAVCLSKINCTLLGGETAEMPGMYQEGEFDLGGFAVGVVNEDKVIDGSKLVKENDIIIGIPSSGIHSNGFSLVRKIIEAHKIDISQDIFGWGEALGETLLTPTLIYVNEIMALKDQFELHGIAHITGGGLVENLPRVIPSELACELTRNSIEVLPIFKKLQELGNVPQDEMDRVFNMGIGLIIVAKPEDENGVISTLTSMGHKAKRIGIVKKKMDKDVVFA